MSTLLSRLYTFLPHTAHLVNRTPRRYLPQLLHFIHPGVDEALPIGISIHHTLVEDGIGQDLCERLFVDSIHQVTRLKRNIKNSLMSLHDKLMLRKRSVIETVNEELKNACQMEHTRHCSVDNFVTDLLAEPIAYNPLPKKPSMNLEIIDKSRLLTN